MTPFENLLSRLMGVKKRSSEQWSARCPAHDDRSPSLSVREAPDGRVLLNCWAGCSAQAVLSSVGLSFEDLYPEKLQSAGPVKPRRLIGATQALELLQNEAIFLTVVAGDMAKGKPIPTQTAERVALAAGRIAVIAEETKR